MNYADAGRNRGGKPTKGMAASTKLAAANNKVIITRASQVLTVGKMVEVRLCIFIGLGRYSL